MLALLLLLGAAALLANCLGNSAPTRGRGVVVWLLASPGVLSGLALVARERLRRKLLVSALFLCLALAAAELSLRRWGPLGPIAIPASADRRTRSEVLADLADEGQRHVQSFHPHSFATPLSIGGRATLPLGGISRTPTLFCNYNEAGQFVRYLSDEYGFRNPPGIWGLEHIDVALIGDSFAMGACVEDGDGIADHIRGIYPATLNLGSWGNGPLLALATLREYLPHVRPRVVAWLFYEGNDFADLHREKANDFLRNYLDASFSQQLMQRQAEMDAHFGQMAERTLAAQRAGQGDPPSHAWPLVNDRRASLPTALRLGTLQRHLNTILHTRSAEPEQPEPDLDLLGRLLDEAQASVTGWGGALHFVYLPSLKTLREGVFHPHRERVLALAAERGLTLTDVSAPMLHSPDPTAWFPFRRDSHFNPQGYRVTAELILTGIAQHLPATPTIPSGD